MQSNNRDYSSRLHTLNPSYLYDRQDTAEIVVHTESTNDVIGSSSTHGIPLGIKKKPFRWMNSMSVGTIGIQVRVDEAYYSFMLGV